MRSRHPERRHESDDGAPDEAFGRGIRADQADSRINPRHPVIVNLGKLQAKERNSTELKDWAQFLVDYVLLQEGSIEEPQRMVDMLQKMMKVASERALES